MNGSAKPLGVNDPKSPAKLVEAGRQTDTKIGVVEEQLEIAAADGFPLGGMLVTPEKSSTAGATVVFNCGGGVAARHYRSFAQFLAAGGIPVLLYDYRGIGWSRPKTLRGFEADLEDWAQYDCAGAIGFMRTRYPDASTVGVGHSIGSLLFTGAANNVQLARLIFVGPHTGYVGDYGLAYRLPMAILWHVAMPLLTRVVGYFPANKLRLGDDIPREIALQWANRRSPVLAGGDGAQVPSRASVLLSRGAALSCNALAMTFSDDAFATPAGARRMLAYFPNLKVVWKLVRPSQLGVRKLGHFGFFRRAGRDLWPAVRKYVLDPPLFDTVSLDGALRGIGVPA